MEFRSGRWCDSPNQNADRIRDIRSDFIHRVFGGAILCTHSIGSNLDRAVHGLRLAQFQPPGPSQSLPLLYHHDALPPAGGSVMRTILLGAILTLAAASTLALLGMPA